MKKSKKIVLTFCSIFVAVFSLCFCFLGSNDSLHVKADTVAEYYSYDGSNTITLPCYQSSSGQINNFLTFNFRVSFSTLGVNTTVVPDFSFYTLSSGANGATLRSCVYSSSFSGSRVSSFVLSNSNVVIHCAGSSSDLNSGGFKIGVKCSSGFNSNVYKIRMKLNTSFTVLDNLYSYSHPLVVEYYDLNDNVLLFEFAVPTNYVFNERTYYTKIDFSDSQQYNAGYSAGLLDNQTNIYNNGYNAGSSAGYGEGYNAGLSDSNQYSFFSLFGAVLDAPISALTGLLNFNLFGVNLLTLFTGLLTLAIILLVLRFIRGGK